MCNCTSEVWSFGPSRNDGFGRLSRLLRTVIGNAPDHRGVAEFLAQVVHRALGMSRTAVEHVGVVSQRSRT
jgi:hypothetical protein